MHSILAAIIAVLIFVPSWYLGGEVMRYFDWMRGLGNSLLQALFRELFVPGVAGYFGVLMGLAVMKRARPQSVFAGLSFAIFVIISFLMTLSFMSETPPPFWAGGLMFLAVLSGAVGAFIAAEEAKGERHK